VPWDELIKSAPEIITRAGQSPLGMVALVILILGILAVIFFQQTPVAVRFTIFVIIFGGACTFIVAMLHEIRAPASPTVPSPAPVNVSGEWDGQGPTEIEEVRRNFQYVYFPPGNMTFSFVSAGNDLRGTLRLRQRYYRAFDTEYGLLDGRVEGRRVSFNVHTEFTVNDAPKVATERFSGDVDGDQIRFTVQEDTGYPPLQFTALRRAASP
jgi:hypothetical protein